MGALFSDSLLAAFGLYTLGALFVSWLALGIWVWSDMQARSRALLARWLAVALVSLLTLPGLLIYLLLRPRETLAQASEREIEEEALLQAIESRPVCPSCSARAQESWQICPACRTRLRKPCWQCNSLLELAWEICPQCAVEQERAQDGEWLLRPQHFPAPKTMTSTAKTTASGGGYERPR